MFCLYLKCTLCLSSNALSLILHTFIHSFLAGKPGSRLVGGGEGGDVLTQKWTCPVCTAADNTGSNCAHCNATPYDMPVESASPDDDLLSDKDVKQFQSECVKDLNKRNGAIRLNKLLFSQGHSNAWNLLSCACYLFE